VVAPLLRGQRCQTPVSVFRNSLLSWVEYEIVTYLLLLLSIINMAAPIVNVGGRKTLYFSSKWRNVVYYCEACIKVRCVSCHIERDMRYV